MVKALSQCVYGQVLLAAAVQDALGSISTMPLLSAPQAKAIVTGFNPKQNDASTSTLLLHNLFERQAARQPQAPCIRTAQVVLSYGEVEARANALAHDLQRKGLEADSAAGILLERGPELYIVKLAVLKAGGAYLPFDSDYPDDRLKYMALDAHIQVLITSKGLASKLAGTGIQVGFSGLATYCI